MRGGVTPPGSPRAQATSAGHNMSQAAQPPQATQPPQAARAVQAARAAQAAQPRQTAQPPQAAQAAQQHSAPIDLHSLSIFNPDTIEAINTEQNNMISALRDDPNYSPWSHGNFLQPVTQDSLASIAYQNLFQTPNRPSKPRKPSKPKK